MSQGIGKSRLLRAIGHKASERGFLDSWGFLAPQDRELPGGAILDQARTMRLTPALADAGKEILRLVESAPTASLTGRRRLALDIVDAFLGVPDEPTFLCFEDVQWADDLSLDVIAELARRSRDRHLLLAAAYRTEEAGPGSSLRDWRSRLVTQRIAEELRLGPLSRDETALVATLILDSGLPAPKDVAAAIHARTDGVPLYIEELLGAVGAEARSSGRAIRDAIVPDTIEDAVLRRLAYCTPEAQAAAQAGAVIGRCFTADVLAGVMDLPQDALDAPLQELIDQFLITPPFDEGYYDFPHQLLREAIYRSVKVGDRRRYHGRAGTFGARLIGQSEIHASAHYERAGMRREAHESSAGRGAGGGADVPAPRGLRPLSPGRREPAGRPSGWESVPPSWRRTRRRPSRSSGWMSPSKPPSPPLKHTRGRGTVLPRSARPAWARPSPVVRARHSSSGSRTSGG